MKKLILVILKLVMVTVLTGCGGVKTQVEVLKANQQEIMQSPADSGSKESKNLEVIINEINTEQYPKVQIFASVTVDGVPVKGLSAADFRVREDDVDQESITVEPNLPPMSVMLTMDTSDSMAKLMEDVQAAAKNFLGTIGSNDSAQVLTFADEVKQTTTMSSNREVASAAIGSTVAHGKTALYDGLYESIQLVKDRTGRKAIVLLSDGADDDGTGKPLSKHNVQEVIASACEVNVPIYALGLGTEVDEAILSSITKETGALYFKAQQASNLNALYGRIGEQLAGQYAINYTSNLPAGGTEHRMVLTSQGVSNTKVYKSPGTVVSGAPGTAVAGAQVPFPDKQEKIVLKQGAGSPSFKTEDNEKHVRKTDDAKLKEVVSKVETGSDSEKKATYQTVFAETAKKRLDIEKGIVLLDVRTVAEYTEKHIPGSVLIPVDDIKTQATEKLKDKNATIFVYCRSGNRSVTAAQALTNMGYTNVYNIGGINSWPYETESGASIVNATP